MREISQAQKVVEFVIGGLIVLVLAAGVLFLFVGTFPGTAAEKRIQSTPETAIFCRHHVCSRCLLSISSASTA